MKNTRKNIQCLIIRTIGNLVVIALFFSVTANAQELTRKWFPGHYLKAPSRNVSNPILIPSNLDLVKDNPYFVGYSSLYFWKSFEPVKDQYDFSAVLADLATCEAHGKKLMFQILNHPRLQWKDDCHRSIPSR